MGLLEACSVLLATATFTGFLGRLWWIFELSAHFRVQLAVALFTLAGLWAWQGRWRTTAICTACATINGVLLLWLLCPTGEVAAAGARLQLVSINVHTANQRSDLLLDFLRHADADVVLLMEVDDRWMDRLAPLAGEYPHRIANARDDNFGIALFSRTALTRASIVELGHAGVPSITAMVRFDGRDILLLGTHPLPPVTSQYAELRNDQLREIAAFVRRQTSPVIVIGDLNTTPWSPFFADLLADGRLRNTSEGRGLFASWPDWMPLARIPLDHCLVTEPIRVVDKRLGPEVGSDHLPVIVWIRINAEQWDPH